MDSSDATGISSRLRRPILGGVAVVCLVSGIVGAFYSIQLGAGSEGFLIAPALSLGFGTGLGAVAGVIAIIRKERWLALHVAIFLANAVSAAFIVWLFRG